MGALNPREGPLAGCDNTGHENCLGRLKEIDLHLVIVGSAPANSGGRKKPRGGRKLPKGVRGGFKPGSK